MMAVAVAPHFHPSPDTQQQIVARMAERTRPEVRVAKVVALGMAERTRLLERARLVKRTRLVKRARLGAVRARLMLVRARLAEIVVRLRMPLLSASAQARAQEHARRNSGNVVGARSEAGMGWDGMGGDVRGGFKVVCYRRGWTRNSSERKGPIRP